MYKERYPVNPNARDYTLEAEGERAVLFVHGFTGSPHFFREYAQFLNREGMHVRVMRLPGHGTHIADLIESSYLDWREAVHQELKALASLGKKTYLLGYSFGANLVLDAAMHYPQLSSGIILISPAMYIRHAWFLRVIARFYERYTNMQYRPKPGIKRRYKKFYSKIAEYEATGSYSSIPVKSGLEFFHFIDHFTKPHLKDVHAPALVLQSDHDPVARPRGAKFVYDRLGSKDKKLVMIDNDEHVIISDDTRKQVYQEALKFIKTH
ncbi:MAG: alpha/beta fold hydrolase [Parcubacteria group bacterium]|nr:alpha/beta fold hydrolase [Parcubacteria group bacterium]